MNRKLPYIHVCRADSHHFVGPFDDSTDALSWAVRSEDMRWHLVMLSPDDAHAPPSVLSPTFASAMQRQERQIADVRVRGGVA